MLKGILAGALLSLLVLAGGAYVAVANGLLPANADAQPGRLETWAARTSLHATLRRDAPRDPSPIAATPANLEAGMKLYAANCAVCHGASDGQASSIAKGLYQNAPQLAKDGVEDDPAGVTYWKIKHGIRLTGMPSFSASMNDTQLWQVSLFLKQMDGLPPEIERQWKRVPSVGAIASSATLQP